MREVFSRNNLGWFRALRCLVFSLLLAVLAGVPNAVFAGGADVIGMDARSIAMGNAATAVSDNYGATFYNPAGLAFSEHNELNLGLTYMASHQCNRCSFLFVLLRSLILTKDVKFNVYSSVCR